MVKRILAIIFIFLGSTAAWFILGSSIFFRTEDQDFKLRGEVYDMWGGPIYQTAPSFIYQDSYVVSHIDGNTGESKSEVRTRTGNFELLSTRINAEQEYEPRRKGLLWYSNYKINYRSEYTVLNNQDKNHILNIIFKFPNSYAVYDDFKLLVNGKEVNSVNISGKEGLNHHIPVAAGEKAVVGIAYKSRGIKEWRYSFGDNVSQVRDFKLVFNTDYKDIDFSIDTLSPTEKKETESGWELVWQYDNLLSGLNIGVVCPENLNPGPLAAKITFFAPVSLFFFFFVIFMISVIKKINLHPMHYFFIACAFFAFHLLFAYLADRVPVGWTFIISSAVSIFLVISYLRLVIHWRFAFVEAGLAQVFYLVLFSYTFFFEGYTGLSVTIGAIITLFILMQMTARINWEEIFASKKELK